MTRYTKTKTNTAAVPSTDDPATTPGVRVPRRERPKRNRDPRDAGQAHPRAPAAVNPTDPVVEPSDDVTPAPIDVGTTSDDATPPPAEASNMEPVPEQPAPDAVDDRLNGADPVHPEEPEVEPARLSPEMKDAFLRFRDSRIGRRSPRVALAMTKLMRIRLPYPRQIQGMGELEEMRLLGIQMRGEQQLGITVFERTGCGKSVLAEQFKMMTNLDAPAGTIPVCHARMGTSGTARDLWVSVMGELQDDFASAGNEHSLRRRAMRAMDDAGVQLLIIDETQHSGHKSGFSREVTAELKIMLDTGKVPIVLLGTEKAVPIIAADRELSGRMFSPCRLAPLAMDDDGDFEMWTGFLKGLDARMVSDGILDEPVGLDDEDLADALGEATDGIIGQLMRIMLTAVRNVARDDRKVMTFDDITAAVDAWSLELKFAKSNPLKGL